MMIQRMHGIDRHKRSATISVMDRSGTEIKFIQSCSDLNKYIETLGPEDAVVFETGLGSFYWADKIEKTGSKYLGGYAFFHSTIQHRKNVLFCWYE